MEAVETKVTGKVKEVRTSETGTSSKGEYKKRLFIVTTPGQYGKDVIITTFGKTCDIAGGLQIGQEVSVSINIESKEKDGRVYNNITAWKIEVIKKADKPAEIPNNVLFGSPDVKPEPEPEFNNSADEETELLF